MGFLLPFFFLLPSLPRWKRLHLNSAYSWRRSPYVRTSFGTLEPSSERREGASQRDFDARRYVVMWLFLPFPLSFRRKRDSARLHACIILLLLINVTLLPLSVEPNLESGANIDCCKLYRDNYAVRGSLIVHARFCGGRID